MSTEQKVAIIRRAPSLGEHRFYSITYTDGGKVTGRSIANHDEIDAWRKDLAEAGWTIAEEVAPEPEPEPEPDPSDPRQIATDLIHELARDEAMRRARDAVAERFDLKVLGVQGYAAKVEEVREHIIRATVTVEIPDEVTE